MKERTRKIFIMIVMAALIVSLMAASFAALTYGRYSGGRRDENSAYEDILDLVGETAFEVSTADELVNAINNGYSYIKIADDAEEPFVINNNVADVYTNLVLDVNGHVVVRNSRNPLLDVRRSISVVLVYDSSTDADGGFYNPVGSSLQTSGGTLTVGEGVYESGPNVEAVQSVTTAEISDVFVRDGGRASATKFQKANAAAQLPKPGKDVYLDETYSGTKNDCLKADTYLLYTVEKNAFVGKVGDTVDGTELKNGQLYVNAKKDVNGTVTSAEEFSPICNVASCDFYYYYPVSGTAGTADLLQTYAVVYGYNDVKALASNQDGSAETLRESGLVWPYAAIRSVEDEDTQEGGVTHARGGVFKTHFGEENTYCIYSAGGTMTVGTSGSAGGPSFEAVGSGVCIAMTGASDNVSEGGSLTISGGTFSSRLGNTIEMENGNMTVTKGSFIKTGCKKGTGDKQLENQTAIISLTGGTLNVSGTKTGDTYSVTMAAGSSENGGTLENVFGIRADDGGEISTTGVSFQIYGDYSAGVLSYDGKIDLGKDTAITVTQSDEKQDGDHILLTSAGVSSEQASEGEEHPVNLSGNVTIDSNGLGITARGVVNVKGGSTSTVTTTRGTGIYVNNGEFNVEKDATINVKSKVQSGFSWATPPESETTNALNIYNGVYVQGGSITSEGTLNVEHTGVASDGNAAEHYSSYAVSVESGDVTLGSGAIAGNSAGGIYVSGGELTAGAVTVSAGGTVQNDNFTANASTYASGVLVKTGTVTLSGAKIYSTALGVAVLGGNFKTEGTSSVTATRATGIYVQGGTVTNSGTLNVTSDLFDDSGKLYESAGADFGGSSTAGGNIYNGVFVNGGSLNSTGPLNVAFKGVENEESGTYLDQQIKSYAVRVEAAASGGDTEVSIAGGEISNSVGGGVLVNGGTVTLGKQETMNGVTTYSGPTVQTTGELLYTKWLEVVEGSWKYMLNKSGGHAVEVSGGSLTVHGGNYTAQQGNGILIRNTSQSQVTNTVMINSGSFLGYNSGYYISQNNKPLESTERMVGPAASYGLNVMGHDLDVTINGGTFGETGNTGNSAASFFGTPDGSRPKVAVHGGTFNANNADAISVFRFIDITFDGTASKISSNISNGAVASLSVQDDLLYKDKSNRGSTIAIQSGTFTGTAYGIWYACGDDKLSISGDATIKGPTGLQVASAPVENGIAISGGTIEGGTEGIYYNASASVRGEGYGLNITGGTIRGTGDNKNGHALNIVVEPKTHAIHIGGSAQLLGGRDAIYVNNAGGERNAVSITGGKFTGAEQDAAGSRDYGCAIWFNSGMNDSVYQITGGRFITEDGGSAIWTSNPDWHYLRQIFPEGCLINDRSYDRNYNFNTTIKGISEITVSMS